MYQCALTLAKDSKFEQSRRVCPWALWISYKLADGTLA